jgi:hypothetical protein
VIVLIVVIVIALVIGLLQLVVFRASSRWR